MSAVPSSPGEAAPAGNPQWPPALAEGIAQFNRREFYRCHETLEAAWMHATGPRRELLQGLLQVGVGFYHLLERNNRKGALTLLRRGVRRLESLGPSYGGVDIIRLLAETRPWIARLEALPQDTPLAVDPDELPQVHSSRTTQNP